MKMRKIINKPIAISAVGIYWGATYIELDDARPAININTWISGWIASRGICNHFKG